MAGRSESIADRLRTLLSSREVTQGDLAKHLGVSQPAVSQWLKDKNRPNPETIQLLATFLGATPEWITYGTGLGPEPSPELGRKEYERYWGARFRLAPADHGRDYGNANVWAFDPRIWTMVRDIVQNSRDAGISPSRESPVKITFKIVTLQGADLEAFQRALSWEQLYPHLEASAAIDQRLGRLIRHSLKELQRTQQMMLLIVEDTGTIGLLGNEFGEGNFAALCRNNLDSNKKSGTAGGAFGLGKAVLWRVSQFSLVLFNSNLSEPTEGEQQDARIFGRCDLPWHSCEGKEYAGPGWLGKVENNPTEGERTVSYWGNRVLARDLYLGRDGLGSGTSIAVVGFHDPSDETGEDADSLAKTIESAVADCFWPDLTAGWLETTVEVLDGSRRRSRKDVVAASWRPEFVDALKKFESGDLVDELRAPGDVACRRVELKVPERVEDPIHPSVRHEALLLVRRAPDDARSDHLNELALFRGVGMVVQYISLRGICLGAVPCHAMLLCGEAAGATPECKMADRFLRTSEPPAHERWTSTPDLKTEYLRGGLTAIQTFFEAAKTAIRELVRPSPDDLSDGPNAIKELLAIGDPPKPEGPKVARPIGTVDDDGSWVIDARIRVKRSADEWTVEPVVVFQQETGGGQAVSWKELQAVSNCSVDASGLIKIPPNVNEARFTGRTDPESHLIDARECTASVELKRIHRRSAEVS